MAGQRFAAPFPNQRSTTQCICSDNSYQDGIVGACSPNLTGAQVEGDERQRWLGFS